MVDALISCETDVDRCTVDFDRIWILRRMLDVYRLRMIFYLLESDVAVHRVTPFEMLLLVWEKFSVIYS